jgi:hypothetical protein
MLPATEVAAAMAVRTDFSVGTFVSRPGFPSEVTTPNPVDTEVPVALPHCGTLPTMVVAGVAILLPPLVLPELPPEPPPITSQFVPFDATNTWDEPPPTAIEPEMGEEASVTV